MKGKVVYTLKIHQVCDYDELKNSVEVFEKLEDAQKEFNEFIKDEKQYVDKDNWVIETDTDMDFEAYRYGEYTSNHVIVSIEEQIIK